MNRALPPKRRAGAALIVVLVLIAMAGAMLVGWTRLAVSRAAEVRLRHEHAQAEWLAAAALTRAAARLAADPDFQSETWDLPAEQLGQAYDATVKISLATEDGKTQATATVTLPSGNQPRVRHTQSINLPNPDTRDET